MAKDDQEETKPEKRAKTVKAKLRVLDHRNQTVHTRWGHVKFDADGCATVDVPEDELQLLRDTKPYPWLDEGAEDRAKWAAEEKKAKAAEKATSDKIAKVTADRVAAEKATFEKSDKEASAREAANKAKADKLAADEKAKFDTSDVKPGEGSST